MDFKAQIQMGIPTELPSKKERSSAVSHAPNRKQILSKEEKQLAIRNALRYFPADWHAVLAPEFAEELQTYGRINHHMICMPELFQIIRQKQVILHLSCS